MRILIQIMFLLFVLLTFSFAFSQNNNDESDSTKRNQDTVGLFETNRKIFLNAPERIKIVNFIRLVNDNYNKINFLSSENIIKINTSSLNQTGKIEIRVKKNDSLWFKISGGFAFIQKDAVIANVNRGNFIYFNNLNDKVIEGPTTDNNIGAIARIKCTFDDLMNVMSAAGKIVYTDDDTLIMQVDSGKTIITMYQRNKAVKYWVNSDNKYVERYSYFDSDNKEYLRIVYSNIINISNGYFAKKVEIEKPQSKEYLKIFNESYLTNQYNLNFNVEFPNDVIRIKWGN